MVIRNINPPIGSAIRVTQDGAEPIVKIPQPEGGVMRYLIGAFLLFWLGGWTFGFFHAATQVLSGAGGAFVAFWLCAWTVGGIFAVAMLYRIFRPPFRSRSASGRKASAMIPACRRSARTTGIRSNPGPRSSPSAPS